MRQPSEPELIIVYTPSDGQCHMIGAGRNEERKWKYSKWTFFPATELNEFLAWCLERGMHVIDARLLANMAQKGMGKATPIVIAHDIDIQLAVAETKRFHKLIVKEANED